MSDVFQEMELAAQRDSKEAEIKRLRNRYDALVDELRDIVGENEGLRYRLAEADGMREEVLHYQREFHRLRDRLAEAERLLRDAREATTYKWNNPRIQEIDAFLNEKGP